MKINNTEKRIIEIKKLLKKWSIEYYEKNDSIVEDSLYDSILLELNNIEEKFPQLITNDSPTQKVGYLEKTHFSKINHINPMLSLKNAFNFDDLKHFEKQLCSIIETPEYFVEPKIDGMSISLIYENGKLKRAVTRGDGLIGENITKNVLQIKTIPKLIKLKEYIEVRGEIFMPIKEFIRINKLKSENGEKEFSNPRNAVSGTLRQLDSNIVKERNIDAIMYWCFDLTKNKYKWEKQSETTDNLLKLGFKISKISLFAKNMEEVFLAIYNISNKRNKIDYEIDGIVIKVNNTNLYENIGSTTKFPKWSIAYKFPTEVQETKLLKIFQTIGRTGKVTYNAKLKPIKISGSNVQKATLHNASYINDLDLRIGDIVRIKKAGEIIPKIISVNLKLRTSNLKKWHEDTKCNSCGEKLFRKKGEVDQYCINDNCKAKLTESIIHFCSRAAMNIDGFSTKQIERFVDLGWIKSFSDIYKLHEKKDQMLLLNGYKNKSINSILMSIEKSKDNSLSQLIFGLGIRYIGKKIAIDISNKYLSLDKIITINFDELKNFNDFGEVRSKSLVKYFSYIKNIEEINKLREAGLNFYQNNLLIDKNSKFFGKKIVITGIIQGIKREEIIEYFYLLGAQVTLKISKKTDYLIVGNKPSENKIKNIENSKIIKIKNINELRYSLRNEYE